MEHLREAREVPGLSLEERAALVAFLGGTFVPHAEAEERFLDPEVARLLGHPDATAAITHDRVAICALNDLLAETDPSDAPSLQGLLCGLDALSTVHFREEDELYLPLLDAQPPEVSRGILQRMGERAHAH